MLRDFEELHRKERVETFFQRRLALLEWQLGNVAEEHVLVEAAVLVEENAGPEIVAGRTLESIREQLASLVFANGKRQRLVHSAEHVVVARDDLEQLRRILHIQEHRAALPLLGRDIDDARHQKLKEDA